MSYEPCCLLSAAPQTPLGVSWDLNNMSGEAGFLDHVNLQGLGPGEILPPELLEFIDSSLETVEHDTHFSSSSFITFQDNDFDIAGSTNGNMMQSFPCGSETTDSSCPTISLSPSPPTSVHDFTSTLVFDKQRSHQTLVSAHESSEQRQPLRRARKTSKLSDPKAEQLTHREVERKYRDGINRQIEVLRRTVPAARLHHKSFGKPSKGVVIASAVDYIRALEKELEEVVQDLRNLRGLAASAGRELP